jgi:hypothetical protein
MGTTVRRPVSSVRQVGRILLVAVELLVAVGAIFGGIGLIANNAIGMLPEWLEGTPFDSWTVPGVLLLLVVALPMSVAAVAELRRSRWAYAAAVAAGMAQIGWIGAQWLIIGKYFYLQPVMLTAGVAVLVFAWLVHRDEPINRRKSS